MDISEKFVVVTITKREARVWATGTAKGSAPEKIFAPTSPNEHHHRNDPEGHGRGEGAGEPAYFGDIAKAISGAAEILLIGHGHGKSSAMLHFVQYLERSHADIAKKVVDALDENLEAMTEAQILAKARDWFAAHPR